MRRDDEYENKPKWNGANENSSTLRYDEADYGAGVLGLMFFIEGSIKLTSLDGTVLQVGAGEGVAIPRGWKGHWSTQGYKKYYVTYDSGSSK